MFTYLSTLTSLYLMLVCFCLSVTFQLRRRNEGILPSLEDLLFYTVAEGQEKIPAHKFITVSLLNAVQPDDAIKFSLHLCLLLFRGVSNYFILGT